MNPIRKRKPRSDEYRKRKNRKKEKTAKKRIKSFAKLNSLQSQDSTVDKKRVKKNSRIRLRGNKYTDRKNDSMKSYSSRQRSSETFRSNELEEYRDRYNSYSRRVQVYEDQLKRGPTEVCHCCGQLFFEKSMTNFGIQDLAERLGNDLAIIVQYQVTGAVQLCRTCCRSVRRKVVPRLCLANGLRFQEIPPELRGLSNLEERLISPRLVFLQIRAIGVDRQMGIKGNIVNILTDVNQCLDVLPRTVSQTETIELKLKRMRGHKSNYLNEIVRPYVVYQAVENLVQQPLFIEEGVTLSVDWIIENSADRIDIIEDVTAETDEKPIEDIGEEWDETIGEPKLNPGGEETLLKEGLVFAPGEGKRPLPILMDENVEELAFPTIYCGHKRQLAIKLSYNEIAKSELRRDDRRCCTVPKIFFMLRKKETIALTEAINIFLRRGQKLEDLRAGNVKASIEELISNDDAYRVLQTDRTSPAYWHLKMKELMAMIRQLGVPTFFLTLSAAETHWSELLVILMRVLENKDITGKEALELSFQEKCNLIRKDPVTCSRYFDHRFRELFKLIQTIGGPFGEYKVVDSYVRIEFQHRGSPHVHCLLWLNGAPQYDPSVADSNRKCAEFIGRFIACGTDEEDLQELKRYQFHKHTKTCRKFTKDSAICRFGVPFFPMDETKILDPLELDSLTDDTIEGLENDLDQIEQKIKELNELIKKNSVPNQFQLNFPEFLHSMDMDADRYELAIRYKLKRSQVFLKRDPKDLRINAFNPEILRRHRANMDLQFILDPYACVHYILNYINKSNRGMSALLKQVVEECKSGYMGHRQKLNRICSKFLNCSEVSSQEAVYILLSMPLSISSRSSVFINTGEKSSRIRILKSEKELGLLDPDSSDITYLGLLDYYTLRPDELESICLADFSAKYTFSKTKKVKPVSDSNEDQPDADVSEEVVHGKTQKLKSDKGYVQMRKRPKVIRYRKYQLEKDEQNYFREKMMLYFPWRDEDKDLLGIDCKQKFFQFKTVIEESERLYVDNPCTDYDNIQNQVESDMKELKAEDDLEELEGDLAIYDLERRETNLEEEMKVMKTDENNPKACLFTTPNLLKDNYYLNLIQSLNRRQRNYLLGTMAIVKKSANGQKTAKPFYHFITGGAGTGKSVLISAVYQSLVRYYNSRFQEPDKVKVLLLGPTGKSAFNIGGSTIHSALGILVSQNHTPQTLSADKKSTFQAELWQLKVIVIDEISMVGASTFQKIDNQLKQIFVSREPFGGISIIAVGDFNQLRPVMDQHVFSPSSKNDYTVLADNCLWRLFRIYRLDEIMRQKDDLIFAKALNNLASGAVDSEDLSLFESRLFQKTSSEIPLTAIRLFPTNAQVESYNDLVLARSPEIGYRVLAVDRARSGTSKRIGESALYSVAHMSTQKTYGLPGMVELKRGVRYMVTTNIDVADGLVNGTTGVLRIIDFYEQNGEHIPHQIWFEFDEAKVGISARSKLKPRLHGDVHLTPINKVVRGIQTKTEIGFVLVNRKQFPIVPAEAITIHKAQGQTYDNVVVDIGRKLDLPALYTSFSRSRTASGLFLVGSQLKTINKRPVDHPISAELNRLEREAKLAFDLKFLGDIENELAPESTRVFFQNLPYLKNHIVDLQCDLNVMAVDILVLVETRANDSPIRGFSLMAQLDSEIPRPFGIGIYKNNKSADPVLFIRSDVIRSGDHAHIEYLAISFRGTIILAVYSSPKFEKQESLRLMESVVVELMKCSNRIIMIGDLNIEIQSEIGIRLQRAMNCIGLEISIEMGIGSNDHNNQIDVAFSNFPVQHSWYYDNLVSDHKGIFFIFQ